MAQMPAAMPRPGLEASETFAIKSHAIITWTAAVTIILSAGIAISEDWPQFRGPNSTGVSASSNNLPVQFSYEDKVLWSAELGEGVAGPVVSGGRVFATAMVDPKELDLSPDNPPVAAPQKFAVFAYDAQTGKQLWRKEFDTGPLPEITWPNTHASSTPATDGDHLYVYFSTLGLLAFDAADGTLLWKYPIPMPFYLMDWGPANSPIVYGNRLIFCLDDDLDPYILALDKYTGKLMWRTPRPEMLGGFSSPVVCRGGEREDIVVAGTGKLKGYDPETGKELWTCNSLLRTIMTTPAVVDDKIYISIQSYGDTDRVLKYALLQWRDTNQDGKLEKSELEKAFWKRFDKGDRNNDGFLVDEEIDAAFQSPNNMAGGGNTIQVIRGGGKGDVTKTHVLWNIENTAPSNIASPLVVNGRLFVVKEGGISACFDAQDGKTIWMRKRIRNLGHYYASPIAGDGKLYVTGENGFVVVLKQGPKMEFLAKNDMGDSCVATPAIADNRLYFRTLHKLYCISEEAKIQ